MLCILSVKVVKFWCRVIQVDPACLVILDNQVHLVYQVFKAKRVNLHVQELASKVQR